MSGHGVDQLIKRFNQGDQRAFEELFHHFFDASLRFVASFIPGDPVAHDIIQDTFAGLWSKRRHFDNPLHFKAFLYKSLRNNTLFYLTRKRRTTGLEGAAHLGEEDAALRRIIEVEIGREITQAVSQLPPERRRIVLLSIEGLTVGRIAGELGISVNTVKTQKKRAYAQLRKEMKNLRARTR